MKRVIIASETEIDKIPDDEIGPSGFCYHNTKSESAANSIITNGFNTGEVDCSSDLYQARGYGNYCIRCREREIQQLNLYPLEPGNFNIETYSEDADGLYESSHSAPSRNIYYIFNIDKLNKLTRWKRFPQGDR